jgi:hypothetical protein
MTLAQSSDNFGLDTLALGIALVIGAIVIVLIWQLAATYRAKASLAREEAYRRLADQAVSAQAETAAALAEIRPKIAAIEQLLRQVG